MVPARRGWRIRRRSRISLRAAAGSARLAYSTKIPDIVESGGGLCAASIQFFGGRLCMGRCVGREGKRRGGIVRPFDGGRREGRGRRCRSGVPILSCWATRRLAMLVMTERDYSRYQSAEFSSPAPRSCTLGSRLSDRCQSVQIARQLRRSTPSRNSEGNIP